MALSAVHSSAITGFAVASATQRQKSRYAITEAVDFGYLLARIGQAWFKMLQLLWRDRGARSVAP